MTSLLLLRCALLVASALPPPEHSGNTTPGSGRNDRRRYRGRDTTRHTRTRSTTLDAALSGLSSWRASLISPGLSDAVAGHHGSVFSMIARGYVVVRGGGAGVLRDRSQRDGGTRQRQRRAREQRGALCVSPSISLSLSSPLLLPPPRSLTAQVPTPHPESSRHASHAQTHGNTHSSTAAQQRQAPGKRRCTSAARSMPGMRGSCRSAAAFEFTRSSAAARKCREESGRSESTAVSLHGRRERTSFDDDE